MTRYEQEFFEKYQKMVFRKKSEGEQTSQFQDYMFYAMGYGVSPIRALHYWKRMREIGENYYKAVEGSIHAHP